MADLNGFDATTVDPAKSFEPIPAGKYEAVIVDSEMREARSGNGEYLWLQFQIIEGDHKGRVLFGQLNIRNANEQARQIAMGELSAICHAVGVMAPQDSAELHDIPLVIKVACEKRKDNGEISNRIKGYEAAGEVVAAAPATAKAAGGKGKAPWARK